MTPCASTAGGVDGATRVSVQAVAAIWTQDATTGPLPRGAHRLDALDERRDRGVSLSLGLEVDTQLLEGPRDHIKSR